ncbi:MAG: Hemolysin [Pseudomonas helleri]|jgi:hypothetical protein|uniref:hypothetical protein n=1 Tax=Pseudomonas helleri TaxID=1608996 RepID=UPI001E28D725|nr:hypothetical protein [Pseudomonas helleri]
MIQIPLTDEDITYLKFVLNRKEYDGGYQYLYEVTHKAIANQADGDVRDQMLMMADWLIAAKSINRLDHSWISEIVYNSMQYAVERSGRKFTARMYKNASDELARQVIMDFIEAKSILPIQMVIERDVQAAVKNLGLEPWHWGGTLGDVFPVWMGGLGHDYVEVPGHTFMEYMGNWTTVIVQNVVAVGMIFENHFGNASMILIIAAKKIFEDILTVDVEINISIPVVPGGGISTRTDGGGGGLDGVTSASNNYGAVGGVPLIRNERPRANVDISLERVGNLEYISPEQISRMKCLLQNKIDPLILDLKGGGVKLTSAQVSPVLFDMNNNGQMIQTGWTRKEEGIVVVDLDNNGKIDNISELMSEYFGADQGSSEAPSERTFDNSFSALRSLDSNKDLLFDNKDDSWDEVKVWVDANQDGRSVTDSSDSSGRTSELYSMDELGISQIDLKFTSPLAERRNGNDIVGVSSFTQNGLVKEAVAVNFSTINPASSVKDEVPNLDRAESDLKNM